MGAAKPFGDFAVFLCYYGHIKGGDVVRYQVDHDLHIHSGLSLCSLDKEQTPARILQYAVENGFKHICLTDHFWDEGVPHVDFDFYNVQNTAYIARVLPLPRAEGVTFHFGCETELDKDGQVGVLPQRMDDYAFIIIPTTHMHMPPFTIREEDDSLERRTQLFVERYQQVLDMDLPFHKVGLAHLTCSLMGGMGEENFYKHLHILRSLPEEVLRHLFEQTADRGMGVELNFAIEKYTGEDLETILRPYRLAKACGCKFYFGSDAHHPAGLDSARTRFETIVDALDLEETDKFRPFD